MPLQEAQSFGGGCRTCCFVTEVAKCHRHSTEIDNPTLHHFVCVDECQKFRWEGVRVGCEGNEFALCARGVIKVEACGVRVSGECKHACPQNGRIVRECTSIVEALT